MTHITRPPPPFTLQDLFDLFPGADRYRDARRELEAEMQRRRACTDQRRRRRQNMREVLILTGLIHLDDPTNALASAQIVMPADPAAPVIVRPRPWANDTGEATRAAEALRSAGIDALIGEESVESSRFVL